MSDAPPMMRLETWSLDAIRPSPANPRKITDEDVEKLAATIRAQGRFADPIEVTESGEIVSGHRRYLAARQLQLVHVPVLVHEGMDEVEASAYRISANRLAEDVKWDRQRLSDQLLDLDALGFDPGSLGFEDDDLVYLYDLDRGTDDDEPGDRAGDDGGDPDVAGDDPGGAEGAEGDPVASGPREVAPGDIWVVGGLELRIGPEALVDDLGAALKLLKAAKRHTKREPLLDGRPLKEIIKERSG